MKINWNNKYNTIAAYSIGVIFSSIFLYWAVSNIQIFKDFYSSAISVLQPFIIGITMAYLLNYVLKFFELKIFNKMPKRGKRGISLVCTYLIVGCVLFGFMRIIVPQLADSIVGLANTIPEYVAKTSIEMDKVFNSINIPESYSNIVIEKWNELTQIVLSVLTNIIPTIGGYIVSVTSSVLNIILGIIISIYVLIDKEKFKAMANKIGHAFLKKEHHESIVFWARKSNNIFGNFIVGKIIDSIIIGILTFIVLVILKMPYALLVSVIVGVTNIIPVFGPFIGAIPGFVIILCVSPTKALWFLLVILLIQQLDGNVIGPYILGDSVGLGAFWILFAVMVFSKLLGLVGMIIGVPIFAIIYAFIKDMIEKRLAKKALPIDTKDYYDNVKKEEEK